MSLVPSLHAYLPRSVQVAEFIKERLRSGYWNERLPSERALAAEIGVSRDTIRAALALLNKKGVVTERRRAGSRVTRRSRPMSPEGMRVGFLLLMPIQFTTYRTLGWVDEMRRLLYASKIEVEIHDGYARKRGFFDRLLGITSCQFWVLIYPNQSALAWCRENKVRAVVAGTVAKEVGLPNVDIHYRALCRHAVGRLVHFRHEHIVFILQRRDWGADVESVRGFEEGVQAFGHKEMSASVEYHTGTPKSLCALADRLLARTPRPTGWIIAVAPHFLTVMMHLQRRGVRIPEEVSLISQDSEPWQHFAYPEPTRYAANINTLAKGVVRFISSGVSGKPLTAKELRIMPELEEGKTLGPAPEGATEKGSS